MDVGPNVGTAPLNNNDEDDVGMYYSILPIRYPLLLLLFILFLK